jgi:hypothetical protein
MPADVSDVKNAGVLILNRHKRATSTLKQQRLRFVFPEKDLCETAPLLVGIAPVRPLLTVYGDFLTLHKIN